MSSSESLDSALKGLADLWHSDLIPEGEYIERLRPLINLGNVDVVANSLPLPILSAFCSFAKDWITNGPVITIGSGVPVVDNEELVSALEYWMSKDGNPVDNTR